MHGIIKRVYGSWGSGLATILIDVGGEVRTFFADNGPLFRGLHAAFGGITDGHGFDARTVIGQEIWFSVNDVMPEMISGFTPVE